VPLLKGLSLRLTGDSVKKRFTQTYVIWWRGDTPTFCLSSSKRLPASTEEVFILNSGRLLQPLFSYIAKGGGLADPASFSIQPTTGGQRCSSQLTPLKEISSPFKLYKTPRSDAMSCRRTSTSI
ncbi:unnamed protein product, partial [Pleuronectes platessa]